MPRSVLAAWIHTPNPSILSWKYVPPNRRYLGPDGGRCRGLGFRGLGFRGLGVSGLGFRAGSRSLQNSPRHLEWRKEAVTPVRGVRETSGRAHHSGFCVLAWEVVSRSMLRSSMHLNRCRKGTSQFEGTLRSQPRIILLIPSRPVSLANLTKSVVRPYKWKHDPRLNPKQQALQQACRPSRFRVRQA